MAKAKKFHSDLCSTLLHASPAAMFLYDTRSLRILAANTTAQARYGYSSEEFRSMTVRDLRPAHGPALSSSLFIDHDAPSRSLWTHVTKTGEPFAVELSVIPYCRGRRRLAVLSVVDASNWSEARLKLVRSEQFHRSSVDKRGEVHGANDSAIDTAIDNVTDNVTDNMEAIGRFAGGVAHDFNNITQSIGLSCELALRGALPLPVRTKLFGIMQQANRAADITQRLLAFSRRQVLQPRVVDLNDCIQESLPALSGCLGLNISMDLRLGEALGPAYVDPQQLTLVLTHLADNARAAMPDGGVLRISTACVSGGANPAAEDIPNRSLLLTVSDTGVGMDDATRRRIFEPFFSTKKTAQTAGLGLATVHGIIHQSNGLIECESAPGRGTTFRIFLPLAVLSTAAPLGVNAAAELPAATPPSAGPGTEQRIRILLVEEDPLAAWPIPSGPMAVAPISVAPISETLEAAGFSVDRVSDGWEALAYFARHPYDLVISGIAIAGLGGVELTRRLRQAAPGVPVILTSSHGNHGSILEDLPHSHIAYLQKPFSGSLLVAIVRNLLPPMEAD